MFVSQNECHICIFSIKISLHSGNETVFTTKIKYTPYCKNGALQNMYQNNYGKLNKLKIKSGPIQGINIIVYLKDLSSV